MCMVGLGVCTVGLGVYVVGLGVCTVGLGVYVVGLGVCTVGLGVPSFMGQDCKNMEYGWQSHFRLELFHSRDSTRPIVLLLPQILLLSASLSVLS